jgi:hypothetical protein
MKKHVIRRLEDGAFVGEDVDCSAQEEEAILAEWAFNAANPPAPLVFVKASDLLAEINQLKARLNAANIPNPPGPPATPPGQSQAPQKAK